MPNFPQTGRCLCKDVEYRLTEDPLTVYLCHCTDCQTQSGSSFAMSMLVRSEAIELERGDLQESRVELEDGRVRMCSRCRHCFTALWGSSSADGFAVVEPGTLDDTSWFFPVGHIWTRSAQPWFPMPQESIRIEKQPTRDEVVELVRAWKNRAESKP